MKKWLLVSVLSLGLSVGALGLAYTNVDQASTATVQTAAKSTTTKSAKKTTAKATKAETSSEATASSTSSAATQSSTAAATTSAKKASASQASRPAAASQTVQAPAKATSTQSQPVSGLAAYYGTWHNVNVTVTLTSSTMTVASAGQAGKTVTYTAVKSGAGYVFSPTTGDADDLYFVLENGQLNWVTGASEPLVLTR
ncbi:hypothetical protein [Lacticaseibacillus salsurivasis]|uniref:hypothetical protein n=1 Tax=Lacticaseibacillus salsurivasis TaxID=3081441 RepID=UPI0030C67DD5